MKKGNQSCYLNIACECLIIMGVINLKKDDFFPVEHYNGHFQKKQRGVFLEEKIT